MSADFNKPALTDVYANFLTFINNKISDVALTLDSALVSASNLPTGSKRWNSTLMYWQTWNGSAWANMAVTYNISIGGNALTANSASVVPWSGVSNKPTTCANFGLTGADLAATLANNPVALSNYSTNAGNLGGVVAANYPQLTTNNTFNKANRAARVALSDANAVALDLSLANNFSLTMTSNIGATRQLANPSNAVAEQSGIIVVTQDATGNRALTFGSNYKFPGGAAPSLTSTANAVDYLSYYVETTSRIFINISKDIK